MAKASQPPQQQQSQGQRQRRRWQPPCSRQAEAGQRGRASRRPSYWRGRQRSRPAGAPVPERCVPEPAAALLGVLLPHNHRKQVTGACQGGLFYHDRPLPCPPRAQALPLLVAYLVSSARDACEGGADLLRQLGGRLVGQRRAGGGGAPGSAWRKLPGSDGGEGWGEEDARWAGGWCARLHLCALHAMLCIMREGVPLPVPKRCCPALALALLSRRVVLAVTPCPPPPVRALASLPAGTCGA